MKQSERIAALEAEVARLHDEVAELRARQPLVVQPYVYPWQQQQFPYTVWCGSTYTSTVSN